MDNSIVTALAALAGSLIGGLTSFASNWTTQRLQDERQRFTQEVAKREALYGEFINEVSKVAVEAVEHEFESVRSLEKAFALLNRIRLTASDEVLLAAEKVIDDVGALYMGNAMTPREVYEALHRGGEQGITDPLRAFSEACRRELQHWSARYAR
jgi:HAMP domain-containing protein